MGPTCAKRDNIREQTKTSDFIDFAASSWCDPTIVFFKDQLIPINYRVFIIDIANKDGWQCLGLIVSRQTIMGQVNKSKCVCDVVGKESYPWHRDSFQEVCSLVVKDLFLEWESLPNLQ